jgi:hypothetical protein
MRGMDPRLRYLKKLESRTGWAGKNGCPHYYLSGTSLFLKCSKREGLTIILLRKSKGEQVRNLALVVSVK